MFIKQIQIILVSSKNYVFFSVFVPNYATEKSLYTNENVCEREKEARKIKLVLVVNVIIIIKM